MGPTAFHVSDNRWAVILAGGDGKRLLPLTRVIAGDDRPKQFCRILGGESLLHATRRRVAKAFPLERTFVVLTRKHQRYFPTERDLPAALRIVQPQDRGTAPAVAYSLFRLLHLDPEASVALFPSDHHFSNDSEFLEAVNQAFEVSGAHPATVVLLGFPPDNPEVQYGWIEPGARVAGHFSRATRYVKRFWEKPHSTVARDLMQGGCLWNSFVMAGRAQAFLRLIAAALPDLVQRFESLAPDLGTPVESELVARVYDEIGSASLSLDVLAVQPQRLAVVQVDGVEWSDLGNLEQVLAALARPQQVRGIGDSNLNRVHPGDALRKISA